MDERRRVTVLDLESDGLAAAEERSRKANAAAEKKYAEMHNERNVNESVMVYPLTERKENMLPKDKSRISHQVESAAQNANAQSILSQAAAPNVGEHQVQRLSAHQQAAQVREEQRKQGKSVGVAVSLQERSLAKTCLPQQDAGQLPVTSVEREQEFASSTLPAVVERDACAPVKFRDSAEVSDTRLMERSAQHLTKTRVIELEYTAAPIPGTKVTGNAVFDEFNKFMDEWLLPEEVYPRSEASERTAAPRDTCGCVSREASTPQMPSRRERQQGTTVKTDADSKSCFPTCCGSSSPRSTAPCPLCNQSTLSVDECRGPSFTHKWTRWVFRQCEEPLDMEAEFLVTPGGQLISSGCRDSSYYQPIMSPYQPRNLGVTQ